MDMGIIGPVLVIAIVGAVYYYFNKVDSDKADKDADVHVKRVNADVQMEQLKIQQKELELKREYFEFEREKLKPRLTGSGVEVDYKVLEDKTVDGDTEEANDAI
jgi:hypothetical protein